MREAVKAEQVLAYTHAEMLKERDWHLFARATAAKGIASTLTLPIVADGRVSGYAPMSDQHIDIETAQAWLYAAARRAGVTVAVVSEHLSDMMRR